LRRRFAATKPVRAAPFRTMLVEQLLTKSPLIALHPKEQMRNRL
jgi:hypothetical protein